MRETATEISADEMLDYLEEPDRAVMDIRPSAAYNGWALQGEPRGGHLPGAKSVPLQWTRYMDWVEVLEEKNLTPDRPTAVYGYTPGESAEMAQQLERLGFGEVAVFNGFSERWSGNPDRPLERLPKYRNLIYPGWLRRLLEGENPPEYDHSRFVVCHSHYDHIKDYNKGHIPGAIPLDTNSLESTETWNRRSPAELRKTLRDLGIRRDTTVVVYGRFSSPSYGEEKFPGKSAGHLGALRCAAIMLYAGVEDVRILNGGITSWETEGYDLSTEPSAPEPAEDFGAEIPSHPEYMIDLPEARNLLASDDGELVSIRSWKEFIGEQSGYHYIDRKGRIPGAVFGNCGSDAYHMENYRNFDHTMREYPEIRRNWKEGGITPDKKIAFYCGTGWRGSEAFIYAWLMGWPDVAVYDGGWFEWCADPSNPIESGPPEQGGPPK